MSNKITFEVNSNEDKMKLKDYIKGIANFSSRLTRDAAKSGRICVNHKVQKLNYILRSGDVITVELSKEESQNVEPEKMELEIVYEDKDLIVVNKSPNMVVHPTRSFPSGTLANGLLYYFKERGENCIVRLVSRLDMDTSGLILVAKNQFAHMALARDMQKEEFEKSYLAVVHGNLKSKKGTIDLPIYKTTDESIQRVVDDRGQRSVTHFEVVKSFKNAELVKLTLETGRTHQIRVHLSHIGHPIYGDVLYGVEEDNAYIERQALHAYRLVFPHPRNGELITLETDLPKDIKAVLDMLDK